MHSAQFTEAQIQTEKQVDFTRKKTRLFDRFKSQLNDRQLLRFAASWRNGRTASQVGLLSALASVIVNVQDKR